MPNKLWYLLITLCGLLDECRNFMDSFPYICDSNRSWITDSDGSPLEENIIEE